MPRRGVRKSQLSDAVLVSAIVAIGAVSFFAQAHAESYIINFDVVRETCEERYENIPTCFGEDDESNFCKARSEFEFLLSLGEDEEFDYQALGEKISRLMENVSNLEKEILEAYFSKEAAKYFYTIDEIRLAQTSVGVYGLRYCSGEEAVSTYQEFAAIENNRNNFKDELRLQFQAGRIAARAALYSKANEIAQDIRRRLDEIQEQEAIDRCDLFVVARPQLKEGYQEKYLETKDPAHPLNPLIRDCE